MTLAAKPVAPIAAHTLLVFLVQVALLLALAFVLGTLTARVKMPPIVGELMAGVIVGPSILAHIAPRLSSWLMASDPTQVHLLDATSQIGVLLLVGLTGLYLDLGLVRRRGPDALRISLAGIAVPLGLGVGAGLLLPGSLIPAHAHRSAFALFLGVALGVSAIPVIAKTLLDLRLLHRNVGQLILCAVAVDDIIGWTLLSIVSVIAVTGGRGRDIALSLGYLGIAVVTAVLARPFIRASLRAAGRSADNGRTISVVVILVLLGAALTQALKLEAVFGAFVIGIVINSCGVLDSSQLAGLRTTVMSFLAPLFFATAGLRIDLTAFARPAVLLTGLGILAAAIFGKFAGAYIGARLSRIGRWEALAIGGGMNARGVIEVIIAMAGLRLGVLSAAMYSIIVMVAIVTSLMAPPILRFAMARVTHSAEESVREEMYGLADMNAAYPAELT